MIRSVLLIFSVLMFLSARSQSDSLIMKFQLAKDTMRPVRERDSLAEVIIDYSRSFLKSPYRYGGRSKKGFDCSGFVSTVYKNFGVTLPRSSKDMVSSGKPVDLPEVRKGDLLLFKNTNRRRKGIGHVGIVTDVKDGEVIFIHSATHKGVKLDYLSAPYYTRHYYKAIRLPLLDSLPGKP